MCVDWIFSTASETALNFNDWRRCYIRPCVRRQPSLWTFVETNFHVRGIWFHHKTRDSLNNRAVTKVAVDCRHWRDGCGGVEKLLNSLCQQTLRLLIISFLVSRDFSGSKSGFSFIKRLLMAIGKAGNDASWSEKMILSLGFIDGRTFSWQKKVFKASREEKIFFWNSKKILQKIYK